MFQECLSTTFSTVTSIKQQQTDGRTNWLSGSLIPFLEMNEIPYCICWFEEPTNNSDINGSFTPQTYSFELTCTTPTRTIFSPLSRGRKFEARTIVVQVMLRIYILYVRTRCFHFRTEDGGGHGSYETSVTQKTVI